MALCLAAVLHVGGVDRHGRDRSRLGRQGAFLLSWALLNFFWLALVRRPVVAALLSLELVVALTLLSRFKFDKLWMTVDFVDVMIIDRDTSAFLLTVFPSLRGWLALAASANGRAFDRSLAARSASRAGAQQPYRRCLVAWPPSLRCRCRFRPICKRISSAGTMFRNSRAPALRQSMNSATHGYLESDAAVTGGLKLAPAVACQPARKLPHIILLHDELSFDITVAPGIKVPAGYQHHFKSLDGKARKLIVEGVGGPSWFTEYNVLTGLSARSYGRFATSVTRIATGHVNRSLPLSLSRCGYKNFSLYPFYGAFLGSRAFQTSVGIANYLDMRRPRHL